MLKYLYVIIFLFIALSFTNGQDTSDFRTKIEKIKLDKLTEKLKLDENTESEFIIKYKQFSEDIKQLNKNRIKIIRKMEQNIEDENKLDSLLNLLLNYENQITNRRSVFLSDLKSILTSRQIVTMILFERKFAIEMRKIIRDYRKENKND